METNNEKTSTLHVRSRRWWVVTAMLILSLACNLLPINLVGREPTPEPDAVMAPQVTDTALPLEEEAAPLVPTETPTQEAVATEVEAPEPTPTEPAPEPNELPLVDAPPDTPLGQIILSGAQGDLWHVNLATGDSRQLIEAPESPSPTRFRESFSPSGRYLAYQNRLDPQWWVIVYDLVEAQEVVRLDDMFMIGWRFGEDVLLVGENTGFCDENDPESSTPDEEVDFLISAYDPATRDSTLLSSIPGGRRVPHGLGSQLNLINLNSRPCGIDFTHNNHVYSELGERYLGLPGTYVAVSPYGSQYVSYEYNLHAPEEDGLWVVSIDGETQVEIYREPGKYVAQARWSPDGNRILFELWGIASPDFQWMVIGVDGSDVREITPYPSRVLGWYDAEHVLIVPDKLDRIELFNADTGDIEILTTVAIPSGPYQILWWWLP